MNICLPSRKRRARARGFTLTEMAIVLVVVGCILAAIWVAVASVHEKEKVNDTVQELQTVVQNMLILYKNRALPAHLAGCPAAPDITTNAINGGVVPGWAIVSGACARAIQPWSETAGDFKISANVPGAPAGNTFRVSFFNVPLDGCIGLITQATACDPTQSGCPAQVLTNGGAVNATLPNPFPAGAGPTGWQTLDVSKIQGLCVLNPAPPAAGNSVEFDYKL